MKRKFLLLFLSVCLAVSGALLFTACGHTHEFDSAWKSDETQHWHECNDCQGKTDVAAHVYDNDCDEDCNVCGATRSVTHDYDLTVWEKDETQHWHECNDCQGKTDVAAHVYDSDCDTDCNVCGAIRTVTHDYDLTVWEKDDTKHWHECGGCQAKADEAEHVYDNACDEDCNVCGAVRTIKHNYGVSWTCDETGHWHECVVCGAKKDFAAHVKSDGRNYNEDEHWYYCSACKYQFEHESHEFLEEKYNEEYDTWFCTGCHQSKPRTKVEFFWTTSLSENVIYKGYTGKPVEITEYELRHAPDPLNISWEYQEYEKGFRNWNSGLPTAIGKYKIRANVKGNLTHKGCTSSEKYLEITEVAVSLNDDVQLHTCISTKKSKLSFIIDHEKSDRIAEGEAITIEVTLSADYYSDTSWANKATLKTENPQNAQYVEVVELKKVGDYYEHYLLAGKFGVLVFVNHTTDKCGVCDNSANESEKECWYFNWYRPNGYNNGFGEGTVSYNVDDNTVEAGESCCVYFNFDFYKISVNNFAQLNITSKSGNSYKLYEVTMGEFGEQVKETKLLNPETDYKNNVIQIYRGSVSDFIHGLLVVFENTMGKQTWVMADVSLMFYQGIVVDKESSYVYVPEEEPVWVTVRLANYSSDADLYYEISTVSTLTCEVYDLDGNKIDFSAYAVKKGETKYVFIKITNNATSGNISFKVKTKNTATSE